MEHIDFIVILIILLLGAFFIILLLFCKNRIETVCSKISDSIFCVCNKIIIPVKSNNNKINAETNTEIIIQEIQNV